MHRHKTHYNVGDECVVSWVCRLDYEAETVVLVSLMKQDLSHLHTEVCVTANRRYCFNGGREMISAPKD